MHILRKIIIALSCGLLPLTLLTFGLSFSLYQTIGKPHAIKSSLDSSGVYETGIENALKEASQNTTSSYGGPADIPTDRPEIQQAIKEAFPPSLLSTEIGGAIDDTYAWLQGTSSALAFTVDLGDAKTRLADSLAMYARDRAAGLPLCSDLSQMPSDIDVFNATCRPAVVSPEAIGAQAQQEVMTSDFLDDTTITADEIIEQGSTEQAVEQLPAAYSQLITSLYVSGMLSLVLIAVTIILHRSKRQGTKRVAGIVLSVGILTIIAGLLSSFLIDALIKNNTGDSGSGVLEVSMLEAATSLVHYFRNWWIGVGVSYGILGTVALVALRLTRQAAPQSGVATPSPQPSQGPPPTQPTAMS